MCCAATRAPRVRCDRFGPGVDHDHVVVAGDRPQGPLDALHAVRADHQFLVQHRQVERRGQHVQALDAGRPDHLPGGNALGDDRPEVELDLGLGDEHLARVGLRVAVGEQGALPGPGEASGQIYGCRALADAALEVRHADDLSRHGDLPRSRRINAETVAGAGCTVAAPRRGSTTLAHCHAVAQPQSRNLTMRRCGIVTVWQCHAVALWRMLGPARPRASRAPGRPARGNPRTPSASACSWTWRARPSSAR